MKLLCSLASKYPEPELSLESIKLNSRVFRILTKYAKQFDIHNDVVRIAVQVMIRYLNKAYFTPKRKSDAMKSLAIVCLAIAEKWMDDPPYQRLYSEYSEEIGVPAQYLIKLEANVLSKIGWTVAPAGEDDAKVAYERRVMRMLSLMVK